jgi:hypothetical protein
LKKDVCPNGDFSPSYYDRECDADDDRSRPPISNTSTKNEHLSPEDNIIPVPTKNKMQTVYEWAYANKLTTLSTFEEARIADAITRAEMAKVMVAFATIDAQGVVSP